MVKLGSGPYKIEMSTENCIFKLSHTIKRNCEYIDYEKNLV